MSSILGSISSPPYATNYSSGANGSTKFDDVSEVDLSLVSSTTGSASVSLNSDLSGVSATTQTGQLAVSFAQAIEQATTVDPATGQREIQQGKAGELASALNALFAQNGFTQDQASQATQSIENELANGQPISLSTSYDNLTSASVSATGAYGANGVWTANSVTQTERSGTLNISIDASGQLNVALNSQTVSTAQYTGEIKGTGAAPAGPVVVIDMPGLGGATQAISLGGAGTTNGSPAVESFGQAAQSALAALVSAMPENLLNGTSAANGNSGIKENETDAAIATASTVAMLVTSTSNASDAPGSNANGGAGSNNGNSQSQSSGATDATGASNNGNAANQGAGSNDNSLSTLLSAVKSEADSLVSLLDAVSKTTLSGTKDAQKQLKDLLDVARQALDPNAASSAGVTHGSDQAGTTSDASGADGANGASNAGAASLSSSTSLSVQISFTQTISIQLVDEQGYGSTLYGRPDGSLGKIVTQPTHVTA
ncbi:MAG TPA: hypothetical protein VL424_05500 [Pararobbsia sp.]|nr:hypothetical protein [Pararobbsia sp.]